MTIFDLVQLVHEKDLTIEISPNPMMPDDYVDLRLAHKDLRWRYILDHKDFIERTANSETVLGMILQHGIEEIMNGNDTTISNETH